MKKLLLALTLIVLTFFTQTNAQNKFTPLRFDSTVIKGTLPNGLTYYIRHNEKPKDRVDFYIVQKVGGILENDKQNGLAHFLEHMCFNGTKNFPHKKLIDYFETKGVKFGSNINASTGLDETKYHIINVPNDKNIVDSALLALHDWSSFVTLDPEEIDKERGVIMEEWRTRNSGSNRAWKKMTKYTFKGSKYAKRDVIGDTMVIKYFKPETIKAYYRKWYRPDLQGIVIVGDIDPQKIESEIKTMFADIKKPVNPAKREYFPVPNNKEPIVGVFTDPEIDNKIFQLKYRFDQTPDQFKLTEQGYFYGLLQMTISSATRIRFNDLKAEPNSPFLGISGGIGSERKTKRMYSFYFVPIKGKETEARKSFLKEVEKIYRYGFTETELKLAKKQLKENIDRGVKERANRSNNSIAQECTRNFLNAEQMPGILEEQRLINKYYDAINKKSTSALLKHIMNKNIVYTIVGPTQDSTYTYPTKDTLLADLKEMSTLKIVPNKDTVKIKELLTKNITPGKVVKTKKNKKIGYTTITLSNGIKINYLKTQVKNDQIVYKSWSKGGTSLYPAKDIITMNLAGPLKGSQGIGNLTPIELQKTMTAKHVSFSSSISTYNESQKGSSSAGDLKTLMQLIYISFQKPRRDDNLFNNTLAKLKSSIASSQKNPRKAYSDSISQILYNYNPRVPLIDKPSKLDGITNDDVLKFTYQRFKNPADFTFYFAGKIDADTLTKYCEKYLGSLKTTDEREKWKDTKIKMINGTKTRVIKKELKTPKVTNCIFYHTPYKKNLKNSLTMDYLTDILDLRYTETIREEEGGSYGVYTNGYIIKIPRNELRMTISFETNPKANEKLLSIITRELKKIAENGPEQKDLEKVRLNYLKKYKEKQDNNYWWLSVMSTYHSSKSNLLKEYTKAVNDVSTKDIAKMAKTILESNNKVTISLEPLNKQETKTTAPHKTLISQN